MAAAVKGGAKVVLTSRDYIYREARPLLKEYAYPLLREQQVVIDVAGLTQQDRRQIFYNHIRLGDQPTDVRAELKSHLDAVADQSPLRPEVARRLGRQAFTVRLGLCQLAGMRASSPRRRCLTSGATSTLGSASPAAGDLRGRACVNAHAASLPKASATE